MIASMTAFAEVSGDHCVWEIKTVNHRYFDVSFRLPDVFLGIEPELRELAKSRVHRGKVEARLNLVETTSDDGISVDERSLAQLIDALDHIRKFGSEDLRKPTLLDVLRWPGIMETDTNVTEELKSTVISDFDQALARVQQAREKEGQALVGLFVDRLDSIRRLLASIGESTSDQGKLIQQRLIDRIQRFNVDVDSQRLAQEVALAAQKADVGEECDRLRLHIDEFDKALQHAGPSGRRLSFLVQEMAREANTLSAKIVVRDCVAAAVDLKVLIDQIREQVQNVE